MAGDWIKMTHALPEKPEVLAIAHKTGLNRFEVVGRLFIVWRWFDNNTVDGNAVSVTKVTLNECLFGYGDVTEFVSAMVDVNWLIESEDSLAVVKFDEHISESAKKRAQTANRVARHKKTSSGNALPNEKVTHAALQNALPREEKRREEENQREPIGSRRQADQQLPNCPHDQIVDLYHEALPELPAVKVMSDARQKAIRSFWRWVLTSKKTDGTPRAQTTDQALTWIGSYFERTNANDFLMGRRGAGQGHSNWRCDFDFLLTEKGKRHVIEKTVEAS